MLTVTSIKDSGGMAKPRVSESFVTLRGAITKVPGKTICSMESAKKPGTTAKTLITVNSNLDRKTAKGKRRWRITHMRVIQKTDCFMEMGFIPLTTAKYMRGSSRGII